MKRFKWVLMTVVLAIGALALVGCETAGKEVDSSARVMMPGQAP